MRDMNIRRLALGGVLAALVLLLTFFIKVPVPATGGYIHLGDGMIFLSALLLGPYAALIGGVGSALADLLGGYMVYVLPTFAIKAAMGATAGLLVRKRRPLCNALVFLLAEAIMMLGYCIFEGLVFGWAAALSSLGPNALQGAAGIAVGTVLSSLPLERIVS